MPYSAKTFDPLARNLVRSVRVDRHLDVGPGAGKFGRMVAEAHAASKRVAVEIEPDYIERFSLREVYTDVRCMSAVDLIGQCLDDRWDLVTIGDCLEHLRKSDGVDLLSFLVYRCRYLFVVYPERYLQGTWNGYRSEAHISAWNLWDFATFDHAARRQDDMVAVCIDGYLRNGDDPPSEELLRSCDDGGGS